MKILILGGTTEARELAGALGPRGDADVVLSLAGRTSAPRAQGVPLRIGGFGGAVGLSHYIEAENIGILIDATYPYAAKISENAFLAARQTAVPFLALRRPPWRKVDGDRWLNAAHVAGAVAALGADPRRVFVALGRKDIAPFEDAPHHTYLIRSVDPVEPPLSVPEAIYLTGRGPFAQVEERALLETHRIDVVVSKNSGGDSTYGKIAAARELGIPVVMIQRPDLPSAPSAGTVDEAVAWCGHALTAAAIRGV